MGFVHCRFVPKKLLLVSDVRTAEPVLVDANPYPLSRKYVLRPTSHVAMTSSQFCGDEPGLQQRSNTVET